jgi:hypothetical protein
MKSWGVMYHKLLMGKPNADIYIDDKNVLLNDLVDFVRLLKKEEL